MSASYRIDCPTATCQRCNLPVKEFYARKSLWVCGPCKAEMPYTRQEMHNRERKVLAAALWMAVNGVTPDEFALMTESSWGVIAAAVRSHCGMPSVTGFSIEARVTIAQALNDAKESLCAA